MTQGLRDANIAVLAGIDLDETAGKTYTANHGPSTRFLASDITDVQAKELLELLPDGATADDLILVGCSPCQYWSRVRTDRERSKAGSRLLLEFARLVEALMPAFVLIENVPGLARRGVDILEQFTADLVRWGYAPPASRVVACEDYGVPQTRRRFVMLTTRLHDMVTLPAPPTDAVRTVRDVIAPDKGFAPISAGARSPTDALHRASALSKKNLKRLQLTPANGGDRSAWRDTNLQIPAYEGKDEQFRSVYGRMWWDKPAPTLTTRFNSLSNGRFGHPEQDRAISLREGAALQTFGPDYVFKGNQQDICRQIGNAVPPTLARILGEHIVRLSQADCEP